MVLYKCVHRHSDTAIQRKARFQSLLLTSIRVYPRQTRAMQTPILILEGWRRFTALPLAVSSNLG